MNRPISLLLVASSLVGCSHGGPHDEPVPVPTRYVAPAYEANIKGQDLGCCIVRDILHTPPQPLQKGQGKSEDPAAWNDKDGALQMALSGAGSMGVFSTGLDFDRGKIFSVSATFRNPVVTSSLSKKPWAIGVVARTGDVEDADNLGRLQVTLRVRNVAPPGDNVLPEAELRVQEGPNAPETTKIGNASAFILGPAYDEIFISGQPFTLTLYIDRATSRGAAILATRTQTVELEFEQALFTGDKGDRLTVAGATFVNQEAERTASVEVTHFEIWVY